MSYPALADLFYIGRYPFAIAALALLVRQRSPGRDLSAVLDTSSIAVAMSLLYWLYVITPDEHAQAGPLSQLASVSFPVMDLGLLVMSLMLVLAPGRRPASFVLLVASLVVTLASDVLFTTPALGGRFVVGTSPRRSGSSGTCCSAPPRCTRRWRTCRAPRRPPTGGSGPAGSRRCWRPR